MATKTKIILAAGGLALIAFVFVIALGDRGAVDLYQLILEKERLEAANHGLREENQKLYRMIQRLKSDRALIENIARTELGLSLIHI